MASCNKFCFRFSIGFLLHFSLFPSFVFFFDCLCHVLCPVAQWTAADDANTRETWFRAERVTERARICLYQRATNLISAMAIAAFRLSCHCCCSSPEYYRASKLLCPKECCAHVKVGLHSNYGWHSRFQWPPLLSLGLYILKRANLLATDNDCAKR